MTTPRLVRSASYFPVGDVAASAAYYASVLGFRTDYIAGSPPEFAICARDGLAIMLRRVAQPARVTPIEKQGGTWDAFFWVEGLTTLHVELASAGATVVYGPTRQEAYQMLEFAIRDPDGHVLGFGEPM